MKEGCEIDYPRLMASFEEASRLVDKECDGQEMASEAHATYATLLILQGDVEAALVSLEESVSSIFSNNACTCRSHLRSR